MSALPLTLACAEHFVRPPFWETAGEGIAIVVAPVPAVDTSSYGADPVSGALYELAILGKLGHLDELQLDVAPYAERLAAALRARGAEVWIVDAGTADLPFDARYRLDLGIGYRSVGRPFVGPVPVGPKKVSVSFFAELHDLASGRALYSTTVSRGEHFDASDDPAREGPRLAAAFATALAEAAEQAIGRFLRWRGTFVSQTSIAGFDA